MSCMQLTKTRLENSPSPERMPQTETEGRPNEKVSASKTKKEPADDTQVECPHCYTKFARPFTLKRHIERKYKGQSNDAEVNTAGACICHHCGFHCRRICDLRNHLTCQHGVIFSYEKISFEDKAGKVIKLHGYRKNTRCVKICSGSTN